MVKSTETRLRNGNRSLQLSLTETEVFLLDAVMANVQRSTRGPHERLSRIGDALAEFLEDGDEFLEDTVADKFPNYSVGTFEMQYEENGKGLHFPEIRENAPNETTQNAINEAEDRFSLKQTLDTPERRVFFVDVGNAPQEKVQEAVDNMKEKFQNKENLEETVSIPGLGYFWLYDIDHFRK